MNPDDYSPFQCVSDLELNRQSLDYQWHKQDPKQQAEDEAFMDEAFMEYLCSELDKGEEE